jgi:hypothetical protein
VIQSVAEVGRSWARLNNQEISAERRDLLCDRFDKLLELLRAQFRRNHLPAWVSGHSLRPEIWTLTDLPSPIRNPVLARPPDKFDDLEKLAASCWTTGFGRDLSRGH